MACTKCGSTDWKLASVVYGSGTSTITTKTVGVGAGVGEGVLGPESGAGIGVASTKGTQQTELAKKAAPPEKPMRQATAVLILGLASFIVGVIFFRNMSNSEHPLASAYFFIFGPFSAALAGARLAFTPHITKRMKEEHQAALAEYARTKMCMRCGELYRDDKGPFGPIAEEDKPLPELPIEQPQKQEAAGTRKCPYCSEDVLKEAVICKHCLKMLDS